MVSGVCGGLGQYFDVNPLFYRVGFVVLTLLGGAGILVYGAAVLVIPREGENESIASDILRNHRRRPLALVGLVLVAVAGVALLSHVPWHIHSDPFWIVILLVGAGMLWARRGRTAAPAAPSAEAPSEGPTAVVAPIATAPRRGWRWFKLLLVTLSVILVLALAGAAAFVAPFLHLGNGVGNRSYQPAVAASVQSQYRLGIGNLDVDLSHVSFGSKPTTVELRLGIGNMRVTVPHDATVLTHARVAWGDSKILGDQQSGHAVHMDVGDPDARLVLDARVGIGKIEVVRASG
jgi:phage shock protein PspC (stress-responsive transcriptional regulator)